MASCRPGPARGFRQESLSTLRAVVWSRAAMRSTGSMSSPMRVIDVIREGVGVDSAVEKHTG